MYNGYGYNCLAASVVIFSRVVSYRFENPLHLLNYLAGFCRRIASGDRRYTTPNFLCLLESLLHKCPFIGRRSIPIRNDRRSIPIPLHVNAMKQYVLHPPTRQCRFVGIKPLEWRGRHAWRIQEQQRLECVLVED